MNLLCQPPECGDYSHILQNLGLFAHYHTGYSSSSEPQYEFQDYLFETGYRLEFDKDSLPKKHVTTNT